MDPPRGNYVAIQIHTSFANGLISLPPSVADARRTLFERMPKSPNRPFYINECDVSQNVFATYGRYKELKRTYAKYDPTR
ncbi:unnamed protein product [Cyclocybe aegerita]|uniref:Uncharacterized protein n=1 Tax=Cyclocybe aegerita TaxID=1973307 RepID=A0A8S0W0T1_CYCAE|nr:unnamed protein product [Cyclocybe aegerita]